MSLTAGSPFSAVPSLPEARDKRSFQSFLRKRDAEFQALQRDNFDLSLKVHHLERELFNHQEPRRASAELEPDDFYNFNDDNQQTDNHTANNTDANFNDDNPVVQALRRELATLREENIKVLDKNYLLSDALDDLREKNVTDAEEHEKSRAGLHAEMQTIVNQIEDLQSENMKCTIEISQKKEEVESAKAEAVNARKEAQLMEKREIAAQAKIKGMRMEFDVTAKSMQEENSSKKEAIRKMAESRLQKAALEKELMRAKDFAEEARAQNEEAAVMLQKMQGDMAKMRREKDAAREALEKEREQGKLWTETEKQLRDGDLLLSEDGQALSKLLSLLQGQQSAYDNVREYEPRWRERVLNDMNDCLRALYRSQREVEVKRKDFVDRFYKSSGAAPIACKESSATAPVS